MWELFGKTLKNQNISRQKRNYISNNFEFAFGQHSGLIDLNKDRYELPRFPINEKYGEIKRFNEVISY